MQRCSWAQDGLMVEYHDNEWGAPVREDRKMFEFLVLEGFQAGLSWSTILNKRENFRMAFKGFDPIKVSKFSKNDVKNLLSNPGIIRNRLKIESAINNSHRFLEVQKEFGSFSKYIWGFVKNKPVLNKFRKLSELPPRTGLSDMISKDLKKRGFKFVGSTIVYAHMQASGMVNDHLVSCFRYGQV